MFTVSWSMEPLWEYNREQRKIRAVKHFAVNSFIRQLKEYFLEAIEEVTEYWEYKGCGEKQWVQY